MHTCFFVGGGPPPTHCKSEREFALRMSEGGLTLQVAVGLAAQRYLASSKAQAY